MREKILTLLGNKIVYPQVAVKNFLESLSVRYASNSDFYQQFARALEDGRCLCQLLDDPSPKFATELKRLNCMGVKVRLNEWRDAGYEESVVTEYLEKVVEELENPSFFSSSAALSSAEYRMLQYLLDETCFNEDWTELEGINNQNLRLVLQQWALFPELVSLKDSCQDLLDVLSISDCKF